MHYLLASIVPYTEANLKLSFSPRRFFDDLARIEDTTGSRSKYRNAYYRAIKLGLLELKGNSPHLTHKGVRTLSAYQPKLLSGQTRLLIAFDIPEQERQLRNKLRTILKEYKFRQVQKSVWESRYDCLKSLKTTIEQCSLENYVRFYEAEPLS